MSRSNFIDTVRTEYLEQWYSHIEGSLLMRTDTMRWSGHGNGNGYGTGSGCDGASWGGSAYGYGYAGGYGEGDGYGATDDCFTSGCGDGEGGGFGSGYLGHTGDTECLRMI